MQIFKSYANIPDMCRGGAVAMGNFDGVHLGHQSVIALARAAAATMDAPLGIVTFEPHPRQFFAPDAPAFRLMNAQTRAHRIAKLGVDCLFEVPFDAELSNLTARAFAQDVLVNGLGIKHLVIGADFRFGKGREGDADMLCKFGDEMGFNVTIAPLVSDEKSDYSSTAIREALDVGRPDDAARILGHWHRIDGIVEHGEKRGRELGFPTANVALNNLHLPKLGVYAAIFDILDGPHKGTYRGVASLGVRPMFGVNKPNLETYIFDFDEDIYGCAVSVALIDFQRPEENFDGIDALVSQISKDCELARATLDNLSD